MLQNKDLLGLRDTGADDIHQILDLAKDMKTILLSTHKKEKTLRGKSVITLFYENSTRTRMSFELAAKYLGGTASGIAASASSVMKGESLIDTALTLDVMGTDIIILRHSMSGAPHLLAQYVNAHVVNAGDGMNEHPTQALLDMFTILEHKKSLDGLKVAMIGDILHSRVARSNIWGMGKLGAEVRVAGPRTFMPADVEKMGCIRCLSVEEAVQDADVVMCLRMQLERQKSALFPSIREYGTFYGINDARIRMAKEDVLIMHPGPMNRGVEITSHMADSGRSVINRQVENGVAVRMAILSLMAG